jgi:hypothetical protein
LSGNNLLVANYTSGTVGEYDATTGAAINANFITGRNSSFGLALSGNNLFVSDTQIKTVGEYNATTGAVINANFITGLTGPVGLALSGNNLFVSNYNAGTVGEYDATTGAAINASFMTGLTGPFGLALSSNNLFVSNYNAGTVGEYDATTGAVINANLITGLSIPEGLALSDNNLFVVNNGSGTVGEYNATTGAAINANLITGLNNPTGLAVASVPEPSTLAMIAVGSVALMGMMLRRKHLQANVARTAGVAEMKFKRLLAILGITAIVAVLGTSAAQAANLLTNGSFEDTTNFVDQGNDTMSLDVGSTAMPGWTVSGSHYLAWIGPTNPFGLTASPNGGSYFLDLTGYIAGAPYSGVSQTIPTQAGATYLLTFDLSSSPQWGLQDGLEVSAGSATASFTTTNDGTQTNLWEPETLSFTATGAMTTISLIGNSGDNYIGLDNVNVVQTSSVPEPATWAMMLIGFGGLGVAIRSARRKQAITAETA